FGFDSGSCQVANDDAAGGCMNACASADIAALDAAAQRRDGRIAADDPHGNGAAAGTQEHVTIDIADGDAAANRDDIEINNSRNRDLPDSRYAAAVRNQSTCRSRNIGSAAYTAAARLADRLEPAEQLRRCHDYPVARKPRRLRRAGSNSFRAR